MSIYSWDTQAVVSTESGTGWTLDVTDANLSTFLEEKDFTVAFDEFTQSNTLFTMVSATILRYDGPATGSVTVEVRRNTDVAPFRLVNYADVVLSGDYNRNLERQSRVQAELRTFSNNPIGNPSIVENSYGATWSGDIINAPTRKDLYDKFEAETTAYTDLVNDLETATNDALDLKAPLDSPALTGAPSAPTPLTSNNSPRLATTEFVKNNLNNTALTGTPTAPTAAKGTETTQIATTAFVGRAVDEQAASKIAAVATLTSPATTLAVPIPAKFQTGVFTLYVRWPSFAGDNNQALCMNANGVTNTDTYKLTGLFVRQTSPPTNPATPTGCRWRDITNGEQAVINACENNGENLGNNAARVEIANSFWQINTTRHIIGVRVGDYLSQIGYASISPPYTQFNFLGWSQQTNSLTNLPDGFEVIVVAHGVL
jgi:hypothetical protein